MPFLNFPKSGCLLGLEHWHVEIPGWLVGEKQLFGVHTQIKIMRCKGKASGSGVRSLRRIIWRGGGRPRAPVQMLIRREKLLSHQAFRGRGKSVSGACENGSLGGQRTGLRQELRPYGCRGCTPAPGRSEEPGGSAPSPAFWSPGRASRRPSPPAARGGSQATHWRSSRWSQRAAEKGGQWMLRERVSSSPEEGLVVLNA